MKNVSTHCCLVDPDDPDAVLVAAFEGVDYAGFLTDDVEDFLDCLAAELWSVHGQEAAEDMIQWIEVFDRSAHVVSVYCDDDVRPADVPWR